MRNFENSIEWVEDSNTLFSLEIRGNTILWIESCYHRDQYQLPFSQRLFCKAEDGEVIQFHRNDGFDNGAWVAYRNNLREFLKVATGNPERLTESGKEYLVALPRKSV